ncbi:PREDICTED: probable glutamate carboxypeptidase 2 isoform X1 [Nelumbo nucifera]|uniref:glutamate carboxypeptidase II n=1 Tax=Nelumbo nucifera TaxID=4432 RepID=A0A1U7Z2R4_NELNU|nr:PREDICTED: probable glutamate carboxypeptidase 2 isoform X1 [Nelumbo nucifera]
MALSLSPHASKHAAISTALPSSYSCTLIFVIFLCMLGLYTLNHTHTRTPVRSTENALRFQEIFLASSTNYTISSYLRALTVHPHLAGTEPAIQTTEYVQTHFRDLGLETHTEEFEALLSYPAHASLSLHFRDGTWKKLSLTEAGHVGKVVVPYHAYSPSGSAFAKAVFVNYGGEEDYRKLEALGVEVTGCVVIARRGEISRGTVVEKAAEKGAVAVLLYADGDTLGGVERGTVMKGLGDPLTPGWAGVEGGEKLGSEDGEVKKRFPKIPSMPISAENAETLLRSLEGARVPYEWRSDALRSRVSRVGPGPTLVNFTYQEEKKMVTIRNIFTVIRGWEEPDRYVLLGNHRDAWTYGAVDPNSGTAALLDIARRYSLMIRLGWTPRRTIILCSWDAEEFGMVGSTEWVEQNLVNLGSKAVAYLNVDCAVQGTGFFARATPQLDNVLVEVAKKIKDPDTEGMTVYQNWAATNTGINIQRLSGVDSDYAPFLQHVGVPSVDMYYGKDYPAYHTAFDSYDWMINYGDPFFQRHVAVSGMWGLLALRLADDSILPFNYLSYAAQLHEYTNVLNRFLDGNVSLLPITTSIHELASAAKGVEEAAKKLREQETKDDLELKRRSLNDRLMLTERSFIDATGLQGKQWFKHLVYGPSNDYQSKLDFFPSIANAFSDAARLPREEAKSAIQHEIWRVARAVRRAASALKGELT